MVSQKSQVAYGLLIGMTVGMLFSAYQSLHGTRPSSTTTTQSPRRIQRVVSPSQGSLLPSAKPAAELVVDSGILAGGSEGASGTAEQVGEAVAAGDPAAEQRFAIEPLPRVCGSPAVDGYAHVVPKCLEDSPTAKAWRELHPEGGKSGVDLACNLEYAVSIDGMAVGWGIGNKKDSPEACCQACREHVPGPHIGGPFQTLPCNAWVYCGDDVCFEADAHQHTKGDCWLKFTEAPQNPEINARGDFSQDFRRRHPLAPPRCQWVSGVLLPPGQQLTNGTWGPRAAW